MRPWSWNVDPPPVARAPPVCRATTRPGRVAAPRSVWAGRERVSVAVRGGTTRPPADGRMFGGTMRRNRRADFVALEARRRREGRGQGHGAAYVPWIHIRELSSRGVSTRIWSAKTGRVHHLLSKLELIVFFVFEWSEAVVDIREQYPLALERTVALAERLGIAHPRQYGELMTMTTDFVLTVRRGGVLVTEAWSVKYRSDSSPRTREKLRLEQAFWAEQGVTWRIATDDAVPDVVVRNLRWIRPGPDLADCTALTVADIRRIAPLLTDEVLGGTGTLADCAARCDAHHGLVPGNALAVARHLLATRRWIADLLRPVGPDSPLELRAVALDAPGTRWEVTA